MSEQNTSHLPGEFPQNDATVPDLTSDKRYTSGSQQKEQEKKPTPAPNSGIGAFAGH